MACIEYSLNWLLVGLTYLFLGGCLTKFAFKDVFIYVCTFTYGGHLSTFKYGGLAFLMILVLLLHRVIMTLKNLLLVKENAKVNNNFE